MPGVATHDARGAARRPLFLGVRTSGRVDADGPSLRVRARGRAETRFPLERVSRVIASPRVDWSAGALRACMETGIPIVIVGDDGAPLGSFHPAHLRQSRFSEAIEELLDRPDWREAYANWLRAARMHLLAEWRETRERDAASLAPGEFGELVRKHVYCNTSDSPFGETAGIWRGGLCALAANTLRRTRLQPVYWGSGGDALELLQDLTRLLELRLRLEVREGMENGLEGEAVLLRVLHARSGDLETVVWESIKSLARRVKQILSEWR
jgi:hypothetical protein